MSRVAAPQPRRRLIILVTAATGGVGRATASRLADAGRTVFAADRREAAHGSRRAASRDATRSLST